MRGLLAVALVAGSITALSASRVSGQDLGPIHDRTRPQPPVVDPGSPSTEAAPGRPPGDATVLFDGKDASRWRTKEDKTPARWKVSGGVLEVVPDTGDIETVQSFGDCQLHVEWSSPTPPTGEDQARGNSGVFLMGLYEVQVLDSFKSITYPDGQAAALYGQYPPLVNASRPPGEWQTYDIVFHGPRFAADGKVTRPARVSVLHNGVLVQDGVTLTGPTAHQVRPPYAAHPEKLPLALQDHHAKVRYRNIWIREIP